jgi:hypothetical protein
MSLNLSQFLAQIKNASTWQEMSHGAYEMLSQMQDHVNNGFQQLGVTTFQKSAPPPPLDSVSVKANNGMVHVTLNHNAVITKTIKYFVECATEPNFLQPHVEELGSSRGKFFPLPGLNDSSVAQPWFFRAYPQYHGSDAGEKTNFGSKFAPTSVAVGGTAALTPLPSTGSGTAPSNGQTGGVGLGTNYQRAPTGPKRNFAA